MTTRKEVLFDKLNGMDYGRPDQIPLTTSRRQHNLRWFNGGLEQVERKKLAAQLQPGFHAQFVHLDTIPTSVPMRNICVGLTKEGIYSIRTQRLSPLQLRTPEKMQLNGRDYSFIHTSLYERWSVTQYNGHLYFVNPQNPVHYTDGISLFTVGGEAPAGKYVEVFYDHLVVAGPVIDGIAYPSRMSVSALYDFTTFTAKTTNEACSRDFTDYENNRAVVEGITGMKRLGNQLFTYTDSTIYTTSYVGLPNVINTNPLVEGVGNSLHGGLVTTDEAHYFFSIKNRQFYQLGIGGGLRPIGNPVNEYWFPMLEGSKARALQVHGYHDPFYKEIWWLLADNSDDWEDEYPQFNRAVVFNYETGAWYTASPEDVHCFCHVPGFARRYDDLVNLPFNVLNKFGMSEIGTTSQTMPTRLWGSKYGRLLTPTTTKSLALKVNSAPFIETKDFTYGEMGTLKEIDQLTMDVNGPVTVEVSVRSQLSDSVTWTTLGIWTPGQELPRFSSLKNSGRVFRFRFTPVTTADFVDTVVKVDPTSETFLTLFGTAFDAPVTAVAVRDDGKVYVAGEFTKYNGTSVPHICRINPDGTLDTSFAPGTGFTVNATYSPPTQLVVSSTGGVWCSLSMTRVIELLTGRDYHKLSYQGVDRNPIIRLSATGSLERDESEVSAGGDVVNVGGIAVDGTDLFIAYVRKGPSTGNLWHTSVAKMEADVLFRRRTMVSNGGFGGGLKLPDVAVQGNQIIWSCPRSLSGTIIDVLREDGVSILNASDYGEQRDITFFVANKKLILQNTWVNAAFNDDVGLSNPVLMGGRIVPGGLNNVYASYLPDTGVFFNGRFGHTSKKYHHRGLYQLKLGELDHYTDPVPGEEDGATVVIGYPQDFGAIWNPISINIGNTAREVTMIATGSGCTFNVVYNGVNLFGGPLTLGSNNPNDPNGTSGTIIRTIALDGLGVTLEIDGYFNLFSGTVQGSTTIDFRWTTGENSGGTLVGVTYPHGWQIGNEDLATAGFDLASVGYDADNTIPTIQPLAVFGDDKAEHVFVNGALEKFRGEPVPLSALWKVSNDGVLDKNFAVKLTNNWKSADGVVRAGKIYAAARYKNYLLIAGRFTQVNGQSTQHIAFVNPVNGVVVGTVQTGSPGYAETITTGGGAIGFRFSQYSQYVYTIAAER